MQAVWFLTVDVVCRPMALMLLCEFILNSTRTPPGEEFLYHTLLELHLMGDEEQNAGAAHPDGLLLYKNILDVAYLCST